LLRRGMISPEDLSFYKVTDSVEDAVGEITAFYRVYNSMRYVGELLVIRLNAPLPPEVVAALSAEFADIIMSGSIDPCGPFPAAPRPPRRTPPPAPGLRLPPPQLRPPAHADRPHQRRAVGVGRARARLAAITGPCVRAAAGSTRAPGRGDADEQRAPTVAR